MVSPTGKGVVARGAGVNNKVVPVKSLRTPQFRYPKDELEQAIQRYVDLFELAPIGYVTFDRFGRIEEINFTGVRLLGRSRKQLIGSTFAICVTKQDTQRFLHHLLECRSSNDLVVTELRLARPDGEKIVVQLSSAPTYALMKEGARLYQTAIIDLTDRKRSEEARAQVLRQQTAVYELAQRHQQAKTWNEIYEPALDAIVTALHCDRASVLLYGNDQVMRFAAWRGISEEYRKAVEGHSPWAVDAENPQPVCIHDVHSADIPKALKSIIRKEGIRAVSFIPLVSGGKLLGKVMAYHNSAHVFANDELKVATTIASQLVQTIERKRSEDALRES